MLSSPISNHRWYDKIIKSPDDKYFVENMNLATDGIDFGSECFVLRKYSKSNPKLLLAVEACDQKHAVTCRLDPAKIKSVNEAPKFPCLKPKDASRKKRDTGQHQGNEKIEGVLFES